MSIVTRRLLAYAVAVVPAIGLLVAASVGLDQPAALVVSIAVVALLGATVVVVTLHRRVVTVGSRDRSRIEPVQSQVAPSHPDTPGRTRARAPGRMVAAA